MGELLIADVWLWIICKVRINEVMYFRSEFTTLPVPCCTKVAWADRTCRRRGCCSVDRLQRRFFLSWHCNYLNFTFNVKSVFVLIPSSAVWFVFLGVFGEETVEDNIIVHLFNGLVQFVIFVEEIQKFLAWLVERQSVWSHLFVLLG